MSLEGRRWEALKGFSLPRKPASEESYTVRVCIGVAHCAAPDILIPRLVTRVE
jgi:hypothetical protein